jgi:hypothetical protein
MDTSVDDERLEVTSLSNASESTYLKRALERMSCNDNCSASGISYSSENEGLDDEETNDGKLSLLPKKKMAYSSEGSFSFHDKIKSMTAKQLSSRNNSSKIHFKNSLSSSAIGKTKLHRAVTPHDHSFPIKKAKRHAKLSAILEQATAVALAVTNLEKTQESSSSPSPKLNKRVHTGPRRRMQRRNSFIICPHRVSFVPQGLGKLQGDGGELETLSLREAMFPVLPMFDFSKAMGMASREDLQPDAITTASKQDESCRDPQGEDCNRSLCYNTDACMSDLLSTNEWRQSVWDDMPPPPAITPEAKAYYEYE